ncbi:MAG: DNA polymerase IV, partial [Candidatus Bathyarchaeota archaeon]
PLPVGRIVGIGKKTTAVLNEMGIETIGDLASFDVSVLIERFGVMGARYHQYAHGIHESEVGGRKGMRKSIGHESTFAQDTDDHTLIFQRLDDICQRIHERAVERNLLFKTATIKIRRMDFQTHTHGKTLPFFTNRLQDLRKTVCELTQGHLRRDEKIRLVGVRVSNLKSVNGQRTLV